MCRHRHLKDCDKNFIMFCLQNASYAVFSLSVMLWLLKLNVMVESLLASFFKSGKSHTESDRDWLMLLFNTEGD